MNGRHEAATDQGSRLVPILFGGCPGSHGALSVDFHMDYVRIAAHRTIFHVFLTGPGRQIDRHDNLFATMVANVGDVGIHAGVTYTFPAAAQCSTRNSGRVPLLLYANLWTRATFCNAPREPHQVLDSDRFESAVACPNSNAPIRAPTVGASVPNTKFLTRHP